MSELNEKWLDTFPGWLRSLGEDVDLALTAAESTGDEGKRLLVAGINYLFKSLDLIPDGIDDIGYLDDAFVLRVACSMLSEQDRNALSHDVSASIKALAEQTPLIREFLGDETYERLVAYTKRLPDSTARGRSVEEIVGQTEVWSEFASEVRSFSKGYETPSFSREERNLIKLRAFFDAKLPR